MFRSGPSLKPACAVIKQLGDLCSVRWGRADFEVLQTPSTLSRRLGGIIPFREFYPIVWLYKVNGIKCCLKLSLCLSTALN